MYALVATLLLMHIVMIYVVVISRGEGKRIFPLGPTIIAGALIFLVVGTTITGALHIKKDLNALGAKIQSAKIEK